MLIDDLGMTLLPWQELVMADWAARDAGNGPSYVTLGLDVARQNGKNAVLEAYEVYLLAACGWHILHTAHRVKTAKKAFRRLEKYFTDRKHPELMDLVVQIRRTNGEEAILLANGGSIEFVSRTNGSARGFDDIQLVVFDEAQELTDPQFDSIYFTLSASSTGERQIVYTGTPPNEASPGTVFTRVREAALRGEAPRCSWLSWSAEKLPPKDSTFDEIIDLVYETNPSMGYILDEDFTRSEFAGATIEGFAHERLGWWSPLVQLSRAISRAKWTEARIDAIGTRYRGKMAFGVKFSADGSTYALAGCKRSNKTVAVELIELGTTAAGTRPLANALMERKGRASCVVVDGLANADALCENMREMKAPKGYVLRMAAKDVCAAASGFKDGVDDGTVKHTGQEALTDSALYCVRRSIGSRGGWGFGSDGAHDSIALEAVAAALWGVRQSKRNPRRKQRIL